MGSKSPAIKCSKYKNSGKLLIVGFSLDELTHILTIAIMKNTMIIILIIG